MRQALAVLLLVLGAAGGCVGSAPVRAVSVSPGELAGWQLLGIGRVEVAGSENALRLVEGADSKGIVLLSPRRYARDVVLRFRIQSERFEGVNVAFLSVSSSNGELDFASDYDGNLGIWQDPASGLRNYMIAFHTGFHQPNAFIRRNPGRLELGKTSDPAAGQRWYRVEVGRAERRLWLAVDGKTLLSAEDSEPLPGGWLGFRLRGPGDGSYSALIADVEIEGSAAPGSAGAGGS